MILIFPRFVSPNPWDVTEPVIEDFLVERRATHTPDFVGGIGSVFGYLRSLDAIPGLMPHVAVTEQEVLLAENRDYLLVRRGLSAPVISAYGHLITPFLDHLHHTAGCRVRADEVNGNVIAGYLNASLPRHSRKSAKMTASVLRSFLGFIHASGYSTVSLFEAAALLAAADRATSTGKRDYAVVLLLLRLGLRRQEAAGCQLSDLDWAAGTLVVHGKGRPDRHSSLAC